MQSATLLTCLWPGLPQLWWRGDWRALLTAISFAAAVNIGLVASFIWPQWLPAWCVRVGWIVVIGYWAAAVWHGRQLAIQAIAGEDVAARDALFREAQTEYLKGHWLEAESLLKRLVSPVPADADAQLLLASLYRRTSRLADAESTLRQLEGAENVAKWQLEIKRERDLLERTTQAPSP